MVEQYNNLKDAEKAMSGNNIIIVVLIIIAFCFGVGMIGYVGIRKAEINRLADIRAVEIKEDKKTERTKERWGVLPWNRKNK